MLRAALATLSLLALDLGTTALCPALSLTGEAAAQSTKYTGRIKRIRIKRTRAGSSFKVSASTDSSGGAKVAGGTATLTDPATGAVVETIALGTPFHGTVVAETTTTAAELGDSFTVHVAGGAVLGSPDIAVSMAKGKGEGAHPDGLKVRATLSPAGTLRLVLVHEDRSWDDAVISGLSITTAAGATLPLSLSGGGNSLDGVFATDLDVHASLTATVSVVDAAGTPLDSASESFTFAGTGTEPTATLVRTAVTTGADKRAQVTTWSENDGKLASLEVSLVDRETAKEVVATTDDTPVLTRQSFAGTAVDFGDDPAKAVGMPYLVLVDWADAEGTLTGTQQEVTLVVPAYDAETGTPGSHTATFADGSGAVALLHDELGVTAIAWTDDAIDVSAAHIIFEEPFEGPPPLETEIDLRHHSTLDKWTQSGIGAVPAAWELTVELVDEKGNPLDGATTTGAGDSVAPATHGRRDGQEEKYMEIVCTDG